MTNELRDEILQTFVQRIDFVQFGFQFSVMIGEQRVDELLRFVLKRDFKSDDEQRCRSDQFFGQFADFRLSVRVEKL